MRYLIVSLCLCIAGPVLADSAQDARVAEGRVLLLSGEFDRAMDLLRPEAEAGHPRAQNLLGTAYQYGEGVPVDFALAQEWLNRAVAQGYPPALHNLGVLFERGGPGLTADPVAAREYFRQAAGMDHSPSTGAYGQYLHDGLGGPADPDAALLWFNRGVELGDVQSIEWMGFLNETGDLIPEDQVEARRLYHIAALMGSNYGRIQYGEQLEFGLGGPQDLQGALDSYLLAFEAEYSFGGYNAAYVILDNPDAFPDQVQGLAYCLWALEHGAPSLEAEWQETCDRFEERLTDKQRAQAALIASRF